MDSQQANTIVNGFSKKRLLIVGDIMIDRYVLGEVERLNPEAPVPVLRAGKETVSTGGAGNAAKNAAALGAKTVLVGVIGDDVAGQDVRDATEAEGYRAVLVTDTSRPTTQKRRYIVKGQQMLRVDWEEVGDVSDDIQEQLVAAIKKEAKGVDAIVVSDYAKGVVTPAVAQAILDIAKEENIPVMADVKPSRIGNFCGVTYISPNRKEAHEYLGLNEHERGGKSKEELAQTLRKQFETSVFLTLSADGMFVHTNESDGIHVPQAHNITIADTSGCGDTAAVVLLLAKLVGATDVEAAELGNAAGAVIATKIGAAALTQEELLDMVGHKHE